MTTPESLPMAGPVSLAEVGALVGDPARAAMLAALMDGRALTASELARHAKVTASTASGHLAKLAASNLLALERQGRHRYYRLASPLVAQMLESVMAVAVRQLPPRRRPASRADDALRQARTCYDHLAGRLGVALAESLLARGHLDWTPDGGALSPDGERFLMDFGLDLAPLRGARRCFCRPCLDWSERRDHLAGALGAGLATRCFDLGWLKRIKDSRALAVTPKGAEGFRIRFDIDLAAKL